MHSVDSDPQQSSGQHLPIPTMQEVLALRSLPQFDLRLHLQIPPPHASTATSEPQHPMAPSLHIHHLLCALAQRENVIQPPPMSSTPAQQPRVLFHPAAPLPSPSPPAQRRRVQPQDLQVQQQQQHQQQILLRQLAVQGSVPVIAETSERTRTGRSAGMVPLCSAEQAVELYFSAATAEHRAEILHQLMAWTPSCLRRTQACAMRSEEDQAEFSRSVAREYATFKRRRSRESAHRKAQA
jgi:hypothetical protein